MTQKITAQMVKELRDKTDAPMMECKKALEEAQGDMSKAELILASRGQKKAQKSAGRTAAEGIIVIESSPHASVMLEINSETDFVARDETFKQFCEALSKAALSSDIESLEDLNNAQIKGENVEKVRENLIAKLGENIQIRRMNKIMIEGDQVIGAYIHRDRIGVQVVLTGQDEELAKDIAMHIAAMNPQYMTPDEMPQEDIETQRVLLLEQEQSSGKPQNVIEKIVDGRLRKIINENCLIHQDFFKNPDQTIGALLKSKGAEIETYIRFLVGEGIEVVKKSFKDEVMAQAQGDKA